MNNKPFNSKIYRKIITPQEASELLKNLFEEQRDLSEARAKLLAAEMTAGQWKLSQDAILLIKGKVANGQTRLRAVVISGVSCEFIVMESDDDDLYKIIDGGKSRSVADVIGGLNCEYKSEIASIARQVISYDIWSIATNGRGCHSGTRSNIIAFINANKPLLTEAARFCKAERAAGQPIVTIKHAGAFLFIAWRENKELPSGFIHTIYSGTSDQGNIDEMLHAFREKMIKNEATKGKKLPSNYIFALMIKVYNAQRQGKNMTWKNLAKVESFPRFFFDKSVDPKETTE